MMEKQEISSRLIADALGIRRDSAKITILRLARHGFISQPVEEKIKRGEKSAVELFICKADAETVVNRLRPNSPELLDSIMHSVNKERDRKPRPQLSKTKNGLTQERLHHLVEYDDLSGIFTWKDHDDVVSHRRGKTAGCVDIHGYLLIRVDGFQYRAHRLAWLYMYGSLPEFVIDHINGDKVDNRISNLRDVRPYINSQNIRSAYKTNKSRLLGAHQVSKNTWASRINVKGKCVHLGYFGTPESASNAYAQAKATLHEGYVK